MLGNPATAYFGQWKMLLHGLARDIWMGVLDNRDPEDNGAARDEDEDGFIKAMEQCILQFCPRTGAKTLQQRAMANYKFKFKRGTGVAAHMTRFFAILKYTDRLSGDDFVQDFDSKLLTFNSFPKAWKLSFLAQRPQIFDSCKPVNIY